MNNPNYRNPDNSFQIVEKNGEFPSVPEVIPTPMANAPVVGSYLNETPMSSNGVAINPVYGPIIDEAPVYGNPVQERPMVGTVTDIGLMDKTVVHEDQMTEARPYQAPLMGEGITHEIPLVTKAETSPVLLSHEESEHFRTHWNEIQGKFVDEPRSAVQQADALVSEVIMQITQMFAKEHSTLESQWNQGGDVSTEDLRMALQRYRSFFNRLVV